MKEKMEQHGFGDLKEFVHFGLTSQDINNTAIPLALKEFVSNLLLPSLQSARDTIFKVSEVILVVMQQMGDQWKDVAMLARTHGQPATPTRIGKEMLVFVERLDGQINMLKSLQYYAKFSGATGGFNAHAVSIMQDNTKSLRLLSPKSTG